MLFKLYFVTIIKLMISIYYLLKWYYNLCTINNLFMATYQIFIRLPAPLHVLELVSRLLKTVYHFSIRHQIVLYFAPRCLFRYCAYQSSAFRASAFIKRQVCFPRQSFITVVVMVIFDG